MPGNGCFSTLQRLRAVWTGKDPARPVLTAFRRRSIVTIFIRYSFGSICEEAKIRLSAGYFIYLPQGVPHAFRVTGSSPIRFLGLAVPAGLMDLYDEVGMPATERRLPGSDGPPIEEEIRRWNEECPRYGLRVVGPPIPSET